ITVDRVNKCGGIAVSPVIIQRRPGGLDLIQRHSAFYHVSDTVPNDYDHVAKFQDVRFVAHAAMAWDNVRSAVLQVFRHRDIDHLIQAFDETIHSATGLCIDNGVCRSEEQVSGNNDVGSAEVHHDITVGMTTWSVVNKDCFAIEIKVALRLEERIQGPF